MSTSYEDSETNLYAYEHNKVIKKITYRKNLVEELREKIGGEFDIHNITDQSFRHFVEKAEKHGYHIYRLIKL